MSGCDTAVPSCVYITAQRQYTAVQKMRTPLNEISLNYNTLVNGCTLNKLHFMTQVMTLNSPVNMRYSKCSV